MNTESKYLYEILAEMINSALKFTQKFIKILNTNLIIQSNNINNMFSTLAHNIFEYKYDILEI